MIVAPASAFPGERSTLAMYPDKRGAAASISKFGQMIAGKKMNKICQVVQLEEVCMEMWYIFLLLEAGLNDDLDSPAYKLLEKCCIF